MDAEIRQIVLWRFRILPLTFRQRDKAIGFYTRKNFTVTIRPTNFDATYLRAASKPEMQAHIIIGDVAGPAAHLLNVFAIACNHGNFGANSVSIGLCPPRDHAQPMT